MNKKNLSKPSSFFGFIVSMFIVSSLIFAACEVDPLSSPDVGNELHSEALTGELNKKAEGKKNNANGNLVTVCHFPPGNPDNPQKITIGANAAKAHMKNHDGDGIVGEDYDENCQPLVVCPCYTADDLATISWSQIRNPEYGSGFRTYLIGSGNARAEVLLKNRADRGLCRFRPKGAKKDTSIKVSKEQASACRALLLEVELEDGKSGK